MAAREGQAARADGLLLIGHGSRDEAGNAAFRELADALSADVTDAVLQACFLEFAEPDVVGGIAALVQRGARRIAVQPLMLFAAGHVRRDIPRLLAEAAAQFPGVALRYGEALGVQPLLVKALCDTVATAAEPAVPTAVLLVGRGAQEEEAQNAFASFGNAVRAATGNLTRCCYLGLARPDLAEGLAACRALPVQQVLVLPHLLFPGLLMQRIGQRVAEAALSDPGRRYRLIGTAGLGSQPALRQLVRERLLALLAGERGARHERG